MTLIAACITALVVWLTPFIADAPVVFVRSIDHEAERQATILFGGDMMFDRSIREVANENGDDFLFSCIHDTLRDADLVVANLEGPITTYPSTSIGSAPGDNMNFTFTFPTSTALLLKRHNISLVNIGNNHTMNFNREGLVQTKEWLDKAGVSYFGDPEALEADKVARLTIHGIPFSFVNWSDWTPLDSREATSNGAGVQNPVVKQIRREAESGHVTVVYAHWGEEYAPPTPPMRQLARSFVDAGAAIVIGSHPHVVQEHEIYKGKNIYYSLGNFVFDQYWDDDVRTGLLLRVVFGPSTTASYNEAGYGAGKTDVVEVKEIPIYLEKDRRTCPKE